MIPGFDRNFLYNFYHLMYVDDLILVSNASRRTARNIKLCLSIYASFTGQHSNISKYAIYFPDWFNKRVASSIRNILNMEIGHFPFNYLGVLISHKRLAQFQSMVDKINKILGLWRHSNLSKAGKTVMINSSLMTILIYYMYVYSIPDTILDKISKAARKLLWASGGNGSGIPLVNWKDTTLSKSDGGLGIRNLRLVKLSLMAKNVFNLLNVKQAFRVDIIIKKYGHTNFWAHSVPPPKCFGFFRGLYWAANIIKPHLWLKVVNPTNTSIW